MKLYCPVCEWEGTHEDVKEYEVINEVELACPECRAYLRDYK